MTILVDFSGLAVASVTGIMYSEETTTINESLVRLTILKSLRKYRLKFRSEYGRKMIIACDAKHYWRKDIFPYYKIGRKKVKEESLVDWSEINRYIRKISEELKNEMPYPVLEAHGAEADDIIGWYVGKFSEDEKIVICSRDKDLKQLQIYPNVKQWNPVDDKGRWEVSNDPEAFLFEHIVRGDDGDSIPNIFSPENSIAIGLRQKPVTVKRLEALIDDGIPESMKDRFELNKKLIEFGHLPEEIYLIMEESYRKQINKDNVSVMKYFQKHNLRSLTESIQDFI